jgi:hypothetical protein
MREGGIANLGCGRARRSPSHWVAGRAPGVLSKSTRMPCWTQRCWARGGGAHWWPARCLRGPPRLLLFGRCGSPRCIGCASSCARGDKRAMADGMTHKSHGQGLLAAPPLHPGCSRARYDQASGLWLGQGPVRHWRRGMKGRTHDAAAGAVAPFAATERGCGLSLCPRRRWMRWGRAGDVTGGRPRGDGGGNRRRRCRGKEPQPPGTKEPAAPAAAGMRHAAAAAGEPPSTFSLPPRTRPLRHASPA